MYIKFLGNLIMQLGILKATLFWELAQEIG